MVVLIDTEVGPKYFSATDEQFLTMAKVVAASGTLVMMALDENDKVRHIIARPSYIEAEDDIDVNGRDCYRIVGKIGIG